MPKVWLVNKSMNPNNKTNCGWMSSCLIKGWKGVNQNRQETDLRYAQSEVVHLLALLTMWGHYLSRYMQKERYGRRWIESREVFWKCLLDVMRQHFVDVINSIHDKRPILCNVCECWSIFLFLPLWKENVKIRMSMLVHILAFSVKDTIFACRVKHEIKRVEKFGIEELWDKDVWYSYDWMDVDTSFVEILFWEKVCANVGDVWVKWNRCWSVWPWMVVGGRTEKCWSYNTSLTAGDHKAPRNILYP